MSPQGDHVPAGPLTATIGTRGRVVLPIPIRKHLDVNEGDRLVFLVAPDGSVQLASLREQIEKVRGMLAHMAPGRNLVDELITERRIEARIEEEE